MTAATGRSKSKKSAASASVDADELRLRGRVADVGSLLSQRVKRLIDAVPGQPKGPVELAKAVGVNKVLTSRVLRAIDRDDPVAGLHTMPGPDPIRQLAHLAGKKGVDRRLVREVEDAASAFDNLIRIEAGDRSGFDALLAAWLPEQRGEFELRRRQAAFKSTSQLRGQQCRTYFTAAFVHPSATKPGVLDIVWVISYLGLQRLRPGVTLKFASRRVPPAQAKGKTGSAKSKPRQLETLDGQRVDGYDGLMVQRYSSEPAPSLAVRPAGEVIHYTLGETGFGPRSVTDLTMVEVGRGELPAKVSPEHAGALRHFFAEVNVPSKQMIFDLYLAGVDGEQTPTLHIYDTAFEGIASVNDRARDIDRLETSDRIEPITEDSSLPAVPWHDELLDDICTRLGWPRDAFTGHRVQIDYPIYGTQATLAYPAPVAGL